MAYGNDPDRHHPAIPGLVEALEKRRIDRREFLRTATLLGMSASMAYMVAGCGDEKKAEQQQEASKTPGKPKKGGILKIGARVPAVDNPATFSWVYDSNIV